jgi:hypothetical protein
VVDLALGDIAEDKSEDRPDPPDPADTQDHGGDCEAIGASSRWFRLPLGIRTGAVVRRRRRPRGRRPAARLATRIGPFGVRGRGQLISFLDGGKWLLALSTQCWLLRATRAGTCTRRSDPSLSPPSPTTWF